MNLSIYAAFDQPKREEAKSACKCDGKCHSAKAADLRADMADLRLYPHHAGLKAVEADEEAITVTWSDNTVGHFHHGWLRENDPGPQSRHPMTRERIVQPLAIRDDIKPRCVAIHPSGALSIRWAAEDGGHTALYDAGWLLAHCYSLGPRETAVSNARPDRSPPANATWQDIMEAPEAIRAWLDDYLSAGWAIVSDVPARDGAVIELGQRIGTIRSSNFGFSFNVRSKAAPISNAYTAGYLPLHTDLPHYEMPPGLQILHCLRNEAEGGESLLADGLAVADLLAREEPETFALLSKNSVPFRFQDETSDFITRHSIIECDMSGRPIYINWSNSTIAPLDVPFETMPAMRAAIRRFVSLIESPRFLIERKLDAGEALVFDNRRMLHGRMAFKPETGARHLQGCYLDTSEVLSRREVLARLDQASTAA